ncbi:MAG: LD-carboxypeptidase [Oceanospirillaceae bacterium]|nr:LD-carboxypeptidase [Oceanospirillaceae bacterium]
MGKIRVEVVATSSVVPKVELHLGLDRLKVLGFEVNVADNIMARDFAYAGGVEQRAAAFYAAAMSASEIVWAVRGGYGASQLLSQLEILSRTGLPPSQKILIGYSDVTALYEFVTQRWGWKILHAPMLASADFHQMRTDDEAALLSIISTGALQVRYREQDLQWLHQTASFESLAAPLYGGNLAVVCSLIGSPWQLDFSGKIVFFEEIGESWCKIDRLLQQLFLSGALRHCKAIVLGEFTNCADLSPRGRVSPDSEEYVNLRDVLTPKEAMRRVFSRLGAALDVPVCAGLAVGHCVANAPLPLQANYRLSNARGLEFISW